MCNKLLKLWNAPTYSVLKFKRKAWASTYSRHPLLLPIGIRTQPEPRREIAEESAAAVERRDSSTCQWPSQASFI